MLKETHCIVLSESEETIITLSKGTQEDKVIYSITRAEDGFYSYTYFPSDLANSIFSSKIIKRLDKSLIEPKPYKNLTPNAQLQKQITTNADNINKILERISKLTG